MTVDIPKKVEVGAARQSMLDAGWRSLSLKSRGDTITEYFACVDLGGCHRAASIEYSRVWPEIHESHGVRFWGAFCATIRPGEKFRYPARRAAGARV